MPKLSNEQREHLVRETVGLLLDLRRAYLQAGASPMKHWDQILDRMRASARTSSSVPEWVTGMSRALQLGSPSKALSSAIERLTIAVVEVGAATWLDLIEREHGYLMARARLESERRKAVAEEVGNV